MAMLIGWVCQKMKSIRLKFHLSIKIDIKF
jgi:hypothetical protein